MSVRHAAAESGGEGREAGVTSGANGGESDHIGGEQAISAGRFKDLLAHLAGTVVIITTLDAAGQVWGFTATSFCSLSLDPPLVLFCLAHDADCHAAFAAAGRFAVSILAADQAELSQRFAQKGNDKYVGVRFESEVQGMPRIPGALAWLECRVHATHPGGDHTITIGMVERGDLGAMGEMDGSHAEAMPLLYYDRGYGTFRKVEGGL